MSTSSTVTNNAADNSKLSPSMSTYDTDKIVTDEPRMSVSTMGSADPRTQDIKSWKAGFQRMQDERLEKQRYLPSDQKEDELTTTALGAKVERALNRRMVTQDATFTRRESLTTHSPQREPVEMADKGSYEVPAART